MVFSWNMGECIRQLFNKLLRRVKLLPSLINKLRLVFQLPLRLQQFVVLISEADQQFVVNGLGD